VTSLVCSEAESSCQYCISPNYTHGALNHSQLELVRHSRVMCFSLGLWIECQHYSWTRSRRGEA